MSLILQILSERHTPNARILYPGKDDFTKQNRRRIFADIKNNDWDCIILTHEQFGMIPPGPRDTTSHPTKGDGLRGREP